MDAFRDLAGTPAPPQVAVVGGGPAGLIAAEMLSRAGADVTVYDRMPTVGRKFLMAGRGGLNLTHSEPLPTFLSRYREAAPALRPVLEAFPPAALRAWAAELGQDTFVGSSGRIFPEAFKASPLLRAWLRRLEGQGVHFALRRKWSGWDDGWLRFAGPDGKPEVVAADATVLALGGASWPRLGSDGDWQRPLHARGVRVTPLRPANSGVEIAWSEPFRRRFAGTPLKNIALSVEEQSARGEAVVTTYGLEGGAVYAHSAGLREALHRDGGAILHVDLRPDQQTADLLRRLRAAPTRQSMSNLLRKAVRLTPVAINLLRECASGPIPREPEGLATLIKAVPIRITAARPLERAISTAGGIALAEIDENYMIRRLPGVFAAGEMLDWEAPTGGYLLQACFATGVAAAQGALRWLGRAEQAQNLAPVPALLGR